MSFDPNNTILKRKLDFKNNTDAIIEETKSFAEHLSTNQGKGDTLSTSQLRKFYGEVKRQQLNGYDPTEFKLLKPKLAYSAGRLKNTKMYDFYKVISEAIDNVTDDSSFKNFIKMMEAVVAYQKFYEKK